MQYSRRDHETSSVGDTARIVRDFGPVGVTVKHRKQADNAHCRRDRSFDIKRNDRTEHHNRQGYTDLDKGNPDTGDTQHAADCHDTDEGHWNEPESSPAKLPREDADHQHCEDVIEARNRMPDTVHKAARVTYTSMGEGYVGIRTIPAPARNLISLKAIVLVIPLFMGDFSRGED